MSRHVEHPEAHLARVAARAEARNARIRATCATPGFGYLVLMLRRFGLGATRYDVDTYDEAKVIVDRVIKNPDYEDGALLMQKSYNPNLMIGGDAKRGFFSSGVTGTSYSSPSGVTGTSYSSPSGVTGTSYSSPRDSNASPADSYYLDDDEDF